MMSMHRHSCLACCKGATLSFAPAPAGQESCTEEDQEARSLHQHVSSSTTPLVVMSTQKASPVLQLHPSCDFMHSGTMHESLYYTHPHAQPTHLQHHAHKCSPSMHYQQLAIPEPLSIEATSSNPNVHVGPAIYCSHTDHVHHQPFPLALPAPTSKSLDLVPKPKAVTVCGSGLLALSKSFVNIDAQSLATYLSLAPICNKLAHGTMSSDDVRILEASSCGAPLCTKSALSCFHSGSEICHHHPPNASQAQICETHSRCIVPALDSSVKSGLLTTPVGNAVPQRPGICRIPHATFQAPAPAKASNPTQPYVSMQENFKQPELLAEMGPNVEDDFWKGSMYDKPPTEGSLGRGRNTAGSGWRGGFNAARGRGRNQGSWNSCRGNNGSENDYAWKSEEPNMAGNARSGTGRGNCGDKRKRDSFNGGGIDDWGSCKQTAFQESKPAGEGPGWSNPHGSNVCNTNTSNGW